MNADGTYTYTPVSGFVGTDTFTYTVSDQDGKTDTATVTVTITSINDAPSGGNDTAEVAEDQSVTIPAVDNDDVDEVTNAMLTIHKDHTRDNAHEGKGYKFQKFILERILICKKNHIIDCQADK